MRDRIERVREKAREVEKSTDELYGDGGRYAAEAYVAGAHAYRTLTDTEWEAMRDRAAEDMALVDEEDGCFEDVREWEGREKWERETYPDEHPSMEYESREYWRHRADAAMRAMGFRRKGQL